MALINGNGRIVQAPPWAMWVLGFFAVVVVGGGTGLISYLMGETTSLRNKQMDVRERLVRVETQLVEINKTVESNNDLIIANNELMRAIPAQIETKIKDTLRR